MLEKILAATASEVTFETWQPDGVTVLEGDPAGRGFTLHEDFDEGARGAGIFECDPAKTTYPLEFNEIIYVLAGEATIEIDNGSRVEVKAGDLAFLPVGHSSTWTFHTRFREFWVLTN